MSLGSQQGKAWSLDQQSFSLMLLPRFGQSVHDHHGGFRRRARTTPRSAKAAMMMGRLMVNEAVLPHAAPDMTSPGLPEQTLQRALARASVLVEHA